MLSTVLFLEEKNFSKVLKSSPVMQIWFHKIPFYHLNERILWKLYLLYTDYLVSQKYKKCSPGKYMALLYVEVSIRWFSIKFDAKLILDQTLHLLSGPGQKLWFKLSSLAVCTLYTVLFDVNL